MIGFFFFPWSSLVVRSGDSPWMASSSSLRKKNLGESHRPYCLSCSYSFRFGIYLLFCCFGFRYLFLISSPLVSLDLTWSLTSVSCRLVPRLDAGDILDGGIDVVELWLLLSMKLAGPRLI